MLTTESQPDWAAAEPAQRVRIPRSQECDYTDAMAAQRREFLRQQTGASLSHIAQYSFDPAILPGNIENFIGVAQVPIGVAGPLRIVASTRVATFISRSPPQRARSSPAITVACASSPRAAA